MSNPLEQSYNGRSKYCKRTAQSYEDNRPDRTHRAELRLLDRIFDSIPRRHLVLDIPCGGGRITRHLAEKGYYMVAGDLSAPMRALAENNLQGLVPACPVMDLDIEHLDLADRCVDTLLCFRLFHHFPDPATRERAIGEMCRVANRFVALSYFSPYSFTSIKRRLRQSRGGRPSQKHATPLHEIETYFAAHGFRLLLNRGRLPGLHTLHVALFERDPVLCL
ncbi:class I SAM-dependent methyltransferase [Enterobacterales bacterium AE_CKDN230030158-1A_HGKHYDSX7]